MERLPTAADFNSRRVTNPSQSEIVRQRFFDWQLYPLAGLAQLSFFTAGLGQGVTTAQGAVVGTGKTQWDTNLEMPGTLPSGKAYMIESIEVIFFPGSSAAANTYVPAKPLEFNAVASATTGAQMADVNLLYQSGMLELNILSKNYLRETPLIAFPPKATFNIDAAVASNAAATSINIVQNMRAAGRPYYIDPTIALQPAVNFDVTLRWPAAIAMPSGFNGRIGVILDGYFMRASQ